MIARFYGTVVFLRAVDSSALSRWIAAIPFEEWPQQHRLADGGIRPAMQTDLTWHGFMEMAAPVVQQVLDLCPQTSAFQQMLSVVMPGHEIEPHVDQQAPYWLARVHVPLTTNPQSEFLVEGTPHHLDVGGAYLVNTLREHAVTNRGGTPRIHFMFDIRRH